jgi:predicted acyl esterase
VPPTGEWKALDDWPPPEARWTAFFLHAHGLLSEHEFWPGEGVDSFEDSGFAHGGLTWATPALVENTEVLGPIVLTVHLSTTDTDALLFATLLLIDRQGEEHELTRGWLRASQRHVQAGSQPWAPEFAHDAREPLQPGEIYELRIAIVPTARLFQVGERIALRLKAADDEPPKHALQAIARNHLRRLVPARLTVHHDENHPSRLDLPITRGNLVGTFISGGDIVSSYTPPST